MEQYSKFAISNIESLKSPTIYFFLKQNGISEHFIKALRKAEDSIMLNDSPANLRSKIKNGDVLLISKEPTTSNYIDECDGNLDIIYEDDDYLVVNKPHGLACIPTRSHFSNNLGGQIMHYMHQKAPNFVLRIINRLDKDTAGIVIVAKSTFAYNEIGKVGKTYHALCSGNLKENLTIDKPILTEQENGINKLKRTVSADGKPSVTHVFPIKNYDGYCHIKCTLETGRTHQIRVHLSSIDHPLIGDSIYSNNHSGTHTFLLLKEVSFKNVHLTVPFPDDWSNYLK